MALSHGERQPCIGDEDEDEVIGPLPESLADYVPRTHGTPEFDRSHLRLGLTLHGILRVLERIGFIRNERSLNPHQLSSWLDREDRLAVEVKDCSTRAAPFYLQTLCGGWAYKDDYKRPPELEWLNETVGPVSAGSDVGLVNVVGYDVAEYLRTWMREQTLDHLSLCEVVLTDDRFADMRHHVGPANLFWSHSQSEPLLGSRVGGLLNMGSNEMGRDSTMYYMAKAIRLNDARLPPKDARFYWLGAPTSSPAQHRIGIMD